MRIIEVVNCDTDVVYTTKVHLFEVGNNCEFTHKTSSNHGDSALCLGTFVVWGIQFDCADHTMTHRLGL